jgi:hypothetical protein
MSERRRRPRARLPQPQPCRVEAVVPDASLGGLLVDLSEAGLGIALNVPLQPHRLVCVELPGFPPLLARVARVARERDGAWLHGCDLIDSLPPALAESLSS